MVDIHTLTVGLNTSGHWILLLLHWIVSDLVVGVWWEFAPQGLPLLTTLLSSHCSS